MPSHITLLYFDSCPSYIEALANLQAVLAERNHPTEVQLIQVETHDMAQTVQFVGSPTIRINGEDIFPTSNTTYALGCRVYNTPIGLRGVPTTEMIREAIANFGL